MNDQTVQIFMHVSEKIKDAWLDEMKNSKIPARRIAHHAIKKDPIIDVYLQDLVMYATENFVSELTKQIEVKNDTPKN